MTLQDEIVSLCEDIIKNIHSFDEEEQYLLLSIIEELEYLIKNN